MLPKIHLQISGKILKYSTISEIIHSTPENAVSVNIRGSAGDAGQGHMRQQAGTIFLKSRCVPIYLETICNHLILERKTER